MKNKMVKLNSLIKYSSVILISFLNFYVMYLIHYDNFWILLDASFDVLTGTPHWRSHQSRLLGPLLLRILFPFGKYYEHTTAIIYVLGFTCFNNLLFYYLLNKISTKNNMALKILILFNIIFLISQDVWLFAWDFVEITFFVAYGYIIITKEYIKFLPLITFVHIFNRESSLLMILFFLYYFYSNYSKENTKTVVFLIFNFFFGIGYMILSRNFLFIQQGDYLDGGQDLENTFLGGNWITPVYNLNTLLLKGGYVEKFIIICSLIILFYYFLKNYKVFDVTEKYLVQVSLVLTLPIFVFGIFTETRQYFPTIVIFTYLIYIRKLKKIKN